MAAPALRIELDLTDESSRRADTDSTVNSWTDLSKRIAEGDTQALAKYYECFFDSMYSEAIRLTGRDENYCLDVVQDSMLKAIRSMKPVRSKSHLEAWSLTVVKCVVYDRIRSEIARQKRQAEYADRKSQESDQFNDSQWVENEARLLWLEEQIDQLDGDLKKMFHLRYRLGWSLSRIAVRFGIKTGAVDGRIRRAVEAIRKKANQETAGEKP